MRVATFLIVLIACFGIAGASLAAPRDTPATDTLNDLKAKTSAGDYRALRDLGSLYRNGDGVARDPELAAALFEQAERRYQDIQAKVGESEATAFFSIGELFYSIGNQRGENARAARWFERAATQGDVLAQFYLGTMFANGEGIAADPALAAQWLLAASRQGDKNAVDAYCRGLATGRVLRDEPYRHKPVHPPHLSMKRQGQAPSNRELTDSRKTQFEC